MLEKHALERLKKSEKEAFLNKQEAYRDFDYKRDLTKKAFSKMQACWQERVKYRNFMNCEFEIAQAEFAKRNEIWEEYHVLKDRLLAKVSQIQPQADKAHAEMKRLYSKAERAYASGDCIKAPALAREAERLRNLRDKLNAEMKVYFDELRHAKEHAKKTAPFVDITGYQQAKERFEVAKAKHEEAQQRFRDLQKSSSDYRKKFRSAQSKHLKLRKKLNQAEAEYRLALAKE